jgi:ATP-dependent RNA helicase DOB1
MSSDDPFSFLEAHINISTKEREPKGDAQNFVGKRKTPSTQKGTDEDESGPSSAKKPRVASPKPVVVDEFETEAKRDVPAIAGLTGGVEAGSRLELRHQVRFFIPVSHLASLFFLLLGRSS